jgi:hypothetical protein
VVTGELSEDNGEWRAGSDGAVVVFEDGVSLKLGPAARIRCWPSTHLALGGPASTPTHVFGLVAGAVVVEDPPPTPKASQAVLIQVPGGLAGVTSGGQLGAVTDGHSSAVANRKGTAWASPNGASHPLDPGTGWSTSKYDANPFRIVPAPTLTAARHAFSGVTKAAVVDGIRWSPVQSARSYVLRFGAKGGATESFETSEPSQPRPFRGVAPGEYTATVTAIDQHGLEGPASAPLALRVVGVALPPGAGLDDDGAISVAERAPIRLTHAAGLLVAYGPTPEWTAAPPELRLFRGESTIAHIRDPKDTTGFDVLLRPRRLVVKVTAGPKRLVWPGDPVRISIHASDGYGGAAPSSAELHPVVTLGVDPVPVEFTRHGSSLTAEIPEPANAGPGPWIVRVQVNDQFGNAIARDFVEIGRRHGPNEPTAPALLTPPKSVAGNGATALRKAAR